jgi:two-component system cell cycle response regulator DivK
MTTAASRGERPAVLLVEPDDDGREMYAEYLRLMGFHVHVVDRTDDALGIAGHADVIVTGLQVRGSFDGVELIRRVRTDEQANRKPIVVLTACAFETDKARSFAAGCDTFLSKPCPPETLVSEIRRVVSLRRPTRN